MKIIRTYFIDIHAKRSMLEMGERISGVSTNIKVDKLEEKPGDLPSGEKVLGAEFTFTVDYPVDKNKKFAEITCKGEVIFVEDKEATEALLKTWKKEEKLPKEIYVPIMRTAFEISVVEAMQLAEKLKIPQPIPIMRLLEVQTEKNEKNKKKENYIG